MEVLPEQIQDPTEKSLIQTKLDTLKNNRSIDLFRSTEIVRLQYRTNMNTIFSCAIIASRQDKLERIELAIKNTGKSTDIQRKLENEKTRYNTLMTTMNCNQGKSPSGDDKVVDRLATSAMIEYCKYTYYLDYFEANINKNFSEALRIDAAIGSGSGNTIPPDTDSALEKIRSRNMTLLSERERAHDTIPKAVMAYQEMDRTYIFHLLLVIIYDDALSFQKNLTSYITIVSQLFEKAFNAQDANQK